jgi:hypothetical protein
LLKNAVGITPITPPKRIYRELIPPRWDSVKGD